MLIVLLLLGLAQAEAQLIEKDDFSDSSVDWKNGTLGSELDWSNCQILRVIVKYTQEAKKEEYSYSESVESNSNFDAKYNEANRNKGTEV